MADPIHRGTFQPKRQRITERWSPTTGHTREFEWRGFDEQQIRGYAAQYAQAGCEYEYINQFGHHHLVATDTSGNVTIDTWEIGVNEILVSSLRNPFNVFNLSAANLEVIARAIKDGSTLQEAQQALEDDTGDVYGDVMDAAAIRLYKRMIAGVDSFYHHQYTLRHTTNCSNRYSLNIADLNVNYIYTTANLLSETQSSFLWVYPLPGRLAYKILSIPFPAAEDDYLWGWLKSASAESTAANNRVNIVTEYKLAMWTTDEYLIV
jgi:hypothetical protein